MAWDILGLLFAVAVTAGTLDTLAGGGGLITVPALLIAGVNPLNALATNKVQGGVGTAMATLMMLRQKQITWAAVKPLMLASFVGSILGTVAVHFIDSTVLEFMIPLVLAITGAYFLFAPIISKHFKAHSQPQTEKAFCRQSVPLVGFYDGMFGPGAGSFFTLIGVSLRQMPLIKATAQAKALNLASNIASVMVYLVSGKVLWTAGLVMMCGQAMGAWIGAHLLVRANPKILRWLIIGMCASMLVRHFLF